MSGGVKSVEISGLRAAVLYAIDSMQREAAGQPLSMQPARVLDFTPTAGLRVLAVNPERYTNG